MGKKTYIIFLPILGLGIFLRFYNLGEPSFWLDEGFSVLMSSHNLPTLIKYIGFDAHPPLYFIILHFWLFLGKTEFVARSLSVVFSLGTLILIYFFCKDCLKDKNIGILASFLYAISAFSITIIDTDVKMYSLLAFLSLLSLYLLIRALQTQKRYLWWLYGFVTLLNFYTHYYSFFIFFAQILYLGWLYFLKKNKYISFIWAWPLLLYIPWIKFFYIQYTIKRGGEALPQGKISILYNLFNQFNGLDIFYYTSKAHLAACLFIYFIIFGLIVFFGILNLKRKFRFSAIILLQLAIILFLPLVINLLTPKHIFQGRYLSIILPLYYILLSFSISFFRRNTLKVCILILFMCTNILSYCLYYKSPSFQKGNWREVVSYIERESEPQDAILFNFTFSAYVFNYYYDKKGFSVEFDDSGTMFFLYTPEYLKLGGLSQYGLDEFNAGFLKYIFRSHKRVWFILVEKAGGDPERRILKWLSKNYYFKKGVKTITFIGGQTFISVGLFEKKEKKRRNF